MTMKTILMNLAVASTLLFSACGNAQNTSEEQQEQSTSGVINKDIDVEEFAEKVEAGEGFLLDVRTDGEFAESHLEGATQIDISKGNFKDEIAKLDKDVPVYVYCRSGGRSGRAAAMMKGMGFKEVYNLEGGIMAWERKGKPVAK